MQILYIVIVPVYFTTFESLIVYRNTLRPCYVLIGAALESSEPLHLLRLMGVSAPSLHRESTDSLIYWAMLLW